MDSSELFLFGLLMCAVVAYITIRLTFSTTRRFRTSKTYRRLWLPWYLLHLVGLVILQYLAGNAIGVLIVLFIWWGVAMSAPSAVCMLVLLWRYPEDVSATQSQRSWGRTKSAVIAMATIALLYEMGYWRVSQALWSQLSRITIFKQLLLLVVVVCL